ncbi:hypothetical protein ABIF69_001095 [Bradyrhizobium japonicum]
MRSSARSRSGSLSRWANRDNLEESKREALTMDLFSTTALNRVVEELPLNPAFFLNTFFTTAETSNTEDIKFDSVKGRRLISPLVSPIVAGKVIREKGYKTQSLAPAYIKDKRVFKPSGQFKRRAGEKIGGSLSPEQRLAASIGFAVSEQLDMWTRRLEVMSAEVLRTGKLVLKGDKLAGPDSDAVAKAMRLQIDMTAATLESARASLGPILITPGIRLVAQFGDYRLWVHADKYVDPLDNVEKDVLPAGEIVMASREIEGVRHFGAIMDLKAGIQPRDFFVKSWEEEDPSVRYILGQSAPLIAPYRVNGTLGAKVK